MAGTVRVPVGAYAPNYSPGSKRRRQQADLATLSKSVKDGQPKWEAMQREMAAKWGVAEEDMDLFMNEPDAYRAKMDQHHSQNRALEKLVDREARIAVEGDTDSNHDNIEAAQ